MRNLSSSLWTLTHLTALHINDNNLTRIPPDIAKLPNLVYLNLSSNKLRSLPAELGNMVSLRYAACVATTQVCLFFLALGLRIEILQFLRDESAEKNYHNLTKAPCDGCENI